MCWPKRGAHVRMRLEARQRHTAEGGLAGRLVGRRHAQHALQTACLELPRKVVDGLVYLHTGQTALPQLAGLSSVRIHARDCTAAVRGRMSSVLSV